MTSAFLASDEFGITPNDVNVISPPAYGVYTRAACTLKYQTAGGSQHTRVLVAGETIPVAIAKVFATGSSGDTSGLTGYKL